MYSNPEIDAGDLIWVDVFAAHAPFVRQEPFGDRGLSRTAGSRDQDEHGVSITLHYFADLGTNAVDFTGVH